MNCILWSVNSSLPLCASPPPRTIIWLACGEDPGPSWPLCYKIWILALRVDPPYLVGRVWSSILSGSGRYEIIDRHVPSAPPSWFFYWQLFPYNYLGNPTTRRRRSAWQPEVDLSTGDNLIACLFYSTQLSIWKIQVKLRFSCGSQFSCIGTADLRSRKGSRRKQRQESNLPQEDDLYRMSWHSCLEAQDLFDNCQW